MQRIICYETHINFVKSKFSGGEKRISYPRRRSVVEHRVDQEGHVEQGHAGRDPLAPGEPGPHRPREDRPPEMVIGQFPVSSRPENEAWRERLVLVLRRERDVILEGAAVDGQPLVGHEPGHFPGLDVVDRDAHQVPGRHLAQGAVVGPDPEIAELAERPWH